MTTVTITISEYASLYGCTPRNVSKNLNNGKLMPFMRGFKKSGGAYLLEVDKNWYDSKINPVPNLEVKT